MNVVEERLKKWKNKLIDLSKRNRLLNFRPTKVTTIRVIDEIPSEIFHAIVLDNTSMEFLPIPEKDKKDGESSEGDNEVDLKSRKFKSYERKELEEKYKDKYLQTTLPKEKLDKNLFRIYSKALSVMEEQGYNVLFLALGCLEWYESENSEVKLTSPIILVPVELKRKSVKSVFKLSYNEEAPILNPALVQKLSIDFGINLDPLDDDLEKINLQEIFQEIQKAVASRSNWRVINDIYLSLFSFSKFIMYKDIETFMETLIENKVLQLICGQSKEAGVSLGLLCEAKELEKHATPKDTLQILDADSTQQCAILAVKRGANLLIEGPPGTGKSQTIANIIAECLAQKKKVLFVSQKMAALEVVKSRLEANQLGDFCLELHSRKTNKTATIKELVRTLELRKKPDHAHDRELIELEKTRDELNKYVKELHAPYAKLEMTPYQAFGIVCSHSDIEDIGYLFKDVKEWTRDKFNKSCDLLDSFQHNLSKIQNPKQNPWRGAKITEFFYEDKVKLIELMEAIEGRYPGFQIVIQKLARLVFFKKVITIADIHNLLKIVELLIKAPKTKKDILTNKLWNSPSTKILSLINAINKLNEFEINCKSKYKSEIVDLDIISLSKRYESYVKNIFFIGCPSFWKDRKLLKQYIFKTYKPSLSQLNQDLKEINNVKEEVDRVDKNSELGRSIFGDIWQGRETRYEAIREFADWIIEFRSYVVKNCFTNEIFDSIVDGSLDKENIKAVSSSATELLDKIGELIRSLFDITKMDEKEALGCGYKEFSLEGIYKKVIDMHKTMNSLDLWIRYQGSYKECIDTGLKDFILKVESRNLSFDKIVPLFKRQFLKCWLDAAFSEKLSLKKFDGDDHQRLINKFREIDRKQIELAKIRLQHYLSGKADSSYQASSDSELGILLRESRKMRAHKPIRKLFQQIPNIIVALKPCLMMSPLSVAQYIDPKLIKFDVVVFDEASQIPPEDSLGTIARGKQVVIAGDSKQLPPTSFFQSEVVTPEDEDFEESLPDDLDSILDECAVSKFPSVMLGWHYRSKHESLITFSNRNFYDGRLNTFPCAVEQSEDLGIKFNYIPNTFYDRGGSGANVEEARKVAEAVFEHFKKYPHLSLGVGTFSIRQKYAVEDAIEDMLKKDNTLESFFTSDKVEHFFVKNLEIIQGDERDVIFLSVGYGKDKNGRLPMNFGPINKNGGHRRLNVLVTRARDRLEVFSSIKGDDFDLSRTDSLGVGLLKKYLDFAEKGNSALMQDIDETIGDFSESPFEESVYNMLLNKGIPVKRQIGCSGYRIDLGVVDSNYPGRYILGIECDGANYHSGATARDRDRLRQQVLESLGWNIYRIWSTDWFKNTKREFEKLLFNIDKARQNTSKKKVPNIDEYTIKYDKSSLDNDTSSDKNLKPYSRLRTKNVAVNHYWNTQSEHFYNCDISLIYGILKRVVEHESPIHKEEAMRRVMEHWKIYTLTDKMRTRIREVIRYRGKIKKVGDFYWLDNMDKAYVRLRTLEDLKKGIRFISPEEIGEAAILTLEKEYSMSEDSLNIQTAKLLGFKRVTEDMKEYLWESILKTIIKKNRIKEIDDRYVLSKGE